ncbi:peptidase M16 [Lentilactobacillus fungorum]|uniref:Peptidase M16 n=1 Tax=Lentilactobacillus fungorum TaxID=2201250 RepID=A0ABQ3VY59_9LACO|nr:pitrilysin family protein [Lentilactobacillus fungorum]GHP12609.1 peptidase M16 [Lentilactobacillus fungorum]
MQTINYPIYGEKLLVSQLNNGLMVYIQPKPGFNKTTAVLGVNYGSIDRSFQLGNQTIIQPAGIAHFLEHKMFDKKDYDVFELFNQTGAASNAYTSFTNTNYLFSTTEAFKENLMILLDFVQTPYFTAAKVEREKGIIDQEINMYQNNPDNQAYFKTVNALYPASPLSSDIAGTISTVNQIRLKDIELAYQTFYRPDNMSLFITGKVDPQETLDWISENQQAKSWGSQPSVSRQLDLSQDQPENRHFVNMTVSRPKTMIGIRGNDSVPTGRLGLKYEIALSLMFDLFFSENADEYDKLYHDEIIDDSFSWEFENERGFHFALLGGDTDHPDEFINRIRTIIEQIPEIVKRKSTDFALQKKEQLGNYIQMMDSQEAISSQFDGFLGSPLTIYDEVAILNELTFQDVVQITQSFLNKASFQEVIIGNTKSRG